MTACRKGHYRKMLAGLARTGLVVLDDLKLAVMGNTPHRNLAKILEDRDERRPTFVTSQLVIKHHKPRIINA